MHENCYYDINIYQKKVEVATLKLGEVNFKVKNTTKDKEDHFMVIKRLISLRGDSLFS